MLYNEFIEGTGCKDNEKNYKVYKDLEIMYMNSDMSKADIYEYGKRLVDNSKSEKELQLEAQIKGEIAEHKAEIAKYKEWIGQNEELAGYWKEYGRKDMVAFYRNPIKSWKQEIRHHKNQINALKSVFGIR